MTGYGRLHNKHLPSYQGIMGRHFGQPVVSATECYAVASREQYTGYSYQHSQQASSTTKPFVSSENSPRPESSTKAPEMGRRHTITLPMVDHRPMSHAIALNPEAVGVHPVIQTELHCHRESLGPTHNHANGPYERTRLATGGRSRQCRQARGVSRFSRLKQPLRFFVQLPSPWTGAQHLVSLHGPGGQVTVSHGPGTSTVPILMGRNHTSATSTARPSTAPISHSSDTRPDIEYHPVTCRFSQSSLLAAPEMPTVRPSSSVYSSPPRQRSIESMRVSSLHSESFSIISPHDLPTAPISHPNPLASNPTSETLTCSSSRQPPPITGIHVSHPALELYASQPTTPLHSRQTSTAVSSHNPQSSTERQHRPRERRRLKKPPPLAHAATIGSYPLTKSSSNTGRSFFSHLFPRSSRRSASLIASQGKASENVKGMEKQLPKTPPPLKRVSLHPPLASARYSSSDEKCGEVVLPYKAGLRQWDEGVKEENVMEGKLAKDKKGKVSDAEVKRCLARARGEYQQGKGDISKNERGEGWLWEARKIGLQGWPG